MSDALTTPPTTQRIDKWLWHARFFKTRTLASKQCRNRKVRIDGTIQTKPSAYVLPGMVLTFSTARAIRVIKILALSTRRGPATEAQALYEDLRPPEQKPKIEQKIETSPANREAGSGRPTKRDRRKIDRLRNEL